MTGSVDVRYNVIIATHSALSNAMLTQRQKQILEYLKKFIKEKGYSPTLEEIGKHFRLSTKSGIYEHLQALEEKGYIKRIKNQARSIRVSSQEVFVKVPLLGAIAAGAPIEAIEHKEYIGVPRNQLPSLGEVYALRVVGNSMIDENINDGDVILVKQQSVAENGERVVALIDNYEATLKKYFKERGYIRLQPANRAMEPIIIKKDREITIQGIVIEVIKNDGELQAEEIFTSKNLKRDNGLPFNKVILGDAIKKLRKLPNESCDVVISDPPYNIGKDFGNNNDKRELGEYVAWCKEWINECIRALKPNGTMFIYGFSEILAYLSVEIPINKRWLIWHYTNKNAASLNFWQRSHEAIICAWKNKPVFNRDEVREPYTEGFLNGAAGKIRKGTLGRFSKNGKETIYKAHENGALPRDVIKAPALAGGAGMIERWFLCRTCNAVFEPLELKKHSKHITIKHPTQKPLELAEKLIKSAMPRRNGVVLVPFAGSGSECVMAKKLGLSYIGIEINPEYVKLAEKWLASTRGTPHLV